MKRSGIYRLDLRLKMEEMPLVSVIIPVYNVEKYIAKCISSLQRQDYENFEIIVVDDGSPDRSANIIDEMSVKDSRIRVIHKSNGGVSSARNVGIENSNGEYLMFVDGDDWVEKNYISEFVRFIKFSSNDIVMNYNYITDNGLPRCYENGASNILTRDQAAQCIYNGRIFVAVWNKLYKRSFLYNHSIRFREDIWFGEGMLFNIECLAHINNVGVMNKTLYHQEANANSAMRFFNLNSYQCGLKSMKIQKSIIDKFKPEVLDAWMLHNYQYHQTIIDGLRSTHNEKKYYSVYKEHISLLRKNIKIPLRLESSGKARLKWVLYYISPSLASDLFQIRTKIYNKEGR